MKLVLGELDMAYSSARYGGGATTTYAVAQILEENYHVMGTFYDDNRSQIAELVAQAFSEQIAVATGSASSSIEFGISTESAIEAMFRRFLDANEMGSRVSIAAAQAGVSHRKKSARAKRKPRPAFIDTGLYRISFRAKLQAA